jgi:hypothetical protein
MALEHLPESYKVADFIEFDKEKDTIKFKFQSGSIKENGVNGCQIDELFKIGGDIVKSLNDKFPCRENALAITKNEECVMWMEARTKNRVKRNVEGKNII